MKFYTDVNEMLNDAARSQITKNSDGTETYNVLSTSGIRHTGTFSPVNTYYKQLQSARKRADKDRLFDLAIQEQARLDKLAEERAYNSSVLAEQRDYDSPTSQLARERAAGINSDLVGSGSGSASGSSSAQMQIPTSDAVKSDIRGYNYYDNISTGFDAFSKVASSVISAVDVFSTLPSRIAVNKSQASLGQAQANEINELLPFKKEGLKLGNTSARLQQLQELGQIFTADTPDTDITSGLSTLGYSADDIPSIKELIKGYHTNPALISWHQTNANNARRARSEARIYTDTMLDSVHRGQAKATISKSRSETALNNLQSRINENLLDSDYAENVAENMLKESNLTSSQLDTHLMSASADFDAMSSAFAYRDNAISILSEELDKLEEIQKERALTPFEKARYDYIPVEVERMKALRSQDINKLYDILMKDIANKRISSVNQIGGLPLPGNDLSNQYSEVLASMFSQYIDYKVTPRQFGKDLFELYCKYQVATRPQNNGESKSDASNLEDVDISQVLQLIKAFE